MTKIEIKAKAAEVIKEEYGLVAPKKDIRLLESHENPDGSLQYVMFMVNGHAYAWDGFTIEHQAPWEMPNGEPVVIRY